MTITRLWYMHYYRQQKWLTTCLNRHGYSAGVSTGILRLCEAWCGPRDKQTNMWTRAKPQTCTCEPRQEASYTTFRKPKSICRTTGWFRNIPAAISTITTRQVSNKHRLWLWLRAAPDHETGQRFHVCRLRESGRPRAREVGQNLRHVGTCPCVHTNGERSTASRRQLRHRRQQQTPGGTRRRDAAVIVPTPR